ncbi:MAG TPA: hypothetical protein VFQ42_22480 [Mycobacterium sp.]|nr:hypothetical protein [Mycobacterium sp.]
MTPPVLSPVRWWRSNADRHRTRGPQIVPAAAQEPGTALAFDLIARTEPQLAAIIAEQQRQIASATNLGVSDAATWSAPADPIGDVRACFSLEGRAR